MLRAALLSAVTIAFVEATPLARAEEAQIFPGAMTQSSGPPPILLKSGVQCMSANAAKGGSGVKFEVSHDEWSVFIDVKHPPPGDPSHGKGCKPGEPYDTITKNGTWYNMLAYDGKKKPATVNIWFEKYVGVYICDVWYTGAQSTDDPVKCTIGYF